MTTHFPLSGPMSVGDLLDRAFRLYRARFGVFLLTAAIFHAPAGIISVLSAEESTVYVLATILNVPATAIASLALTAHSIEALHSRSVTTGEGIRRGLRRFWPYVGMTIVKWAAILAATVVALIPFVIGMRVLDGLPGSPASTALDWILGYGMTDIGDVLGAIGMSICGYVPLLILLLAPNIYLYARWLAAPAALLAEGTGPIDSLRRSWRLSQGNVLRIVGYVILLGLLTFILPIVIETALQWIFEIISPTGASELMLRFPAAFSSLFLIVSMPFSVGAAVLLYYDLRIRGENYDLELRVADLEEEAARDADQDGAAVDAGAGGVG